MDQITSVMGADDNIIEALRVICERSNPSLIGLVTTGLSETQGADIRRVVLTFRERFPLFVGTEIVAVNTPDFSGSFESGFALAVRGLIETLVPEGRSRAGTRTRQINVLCGGNLTPGDLEFITESIESFGLRPLLIPDLSGSLDGHLGEDHFSPMTTGGVSVDDIATAGESIATLAVGESLHQAATLLKNRTSVPAFYFGHLLGLESLDAWFLTLSELSSCPVPERWQRQRRQLLDAMLDTHFMLGQARVAIAADADLLSGYNRLLDEMGALTVAAVVPAKGTASLQRPSATDVQVGDLEDLEKLARQHKAQLLLASSHGAETARRLGIPLLRIGFPQYDQVGGFQRCWFGYRGTTQALFDLANLVTAQHKDMPAYHSIYAQKHETEQASDTPKEWRHCV